MSGVTVGVCRSAVLDICRQFPHDVLRDVEPSRLLALQGGLVRVRVDLAADGFVR
jgi:hypothetical protein